MRATMHCGKRGTLQHNDHDPKTKRAEWDKSKTKQNYLWSADGKRADGTFKTVAEAELDSYNRIYGQALAQQNQKHINNRQYGRVREMKDWMESAQYRACEMLLQIGNKDERVDETGDVLWDCAVEFINWKQQRYKGNYEVLSMSLHLDESTPHIHVRETWFYHDKQGVAHPGIKGALREIGVALPDPTKAEGEDNYRKTAVDAECRAKFREIIMAHGIELESEPLPPRQHMDKKSYKAYKASEKALSERERKVSKRESELKTRETSLNDSERVLRAKEQELTLKEQEMALQASQLAQKERELDEERERLARKEQQFDELVKSEVKSQLRTAERRRAHADMQANNITQRHRGEDVDFDIRY